MTGDNVNSCAPLLVLLLLSGYPRDIHCQAPLQCLLSHLQQPAWGCAPIDVDVHGIPSLAHLCGHSRHRPIVRNIKSALPSHFVDDLIPRRITPWWAARSEHGRITSIYTEAVSLTQPIH